MAPRRTRSLEWRSARSRQPWKFADEGRDDCGSEGLGNLASVRSTKGLCKGFHVIPFTPPLSQKYVGTTRKKPQFQVRCRPRSEVHMRHRHNFHQPTTIFLAELDRAWTTTPCTYIRKSEGNTDPHERGQHPAAREKEKAGGPCVRNVDNISGHG